MSQKKSKVHVWFGSFLLSELARALAQQLQTQGAVLVFPGSKLEAVDKVSVANKIVANLPVHLKPGTAVKTARATMGGLAGCETVRSMHLRSACDAYNAKENRSSFIALLKSRWRILSNCNGLRVLPRPIA